MRSPFFLTVDRQNKNMPGCSSARACCGGFLETYSLAHIGSLDSGRLLFRQGLANGQSRLRWDRSGPAGHARSGAAGVRRNGLGMAIVSTPRGLMTDREARTANLGGELLAVVW